MFIFVTAAFMKSYCLLLFLLILSISSFAQNGKFRLIGKITNDKAIEQATIYTYGASKFMKDTVKVNNGEFVFEGTIDKPCMAVINTDKVKNGLGVWLTADEIKVDFLVKKYDEGYVLLQPVKIEGSQESIDNLSLITKGNEFFEIEKNEIKRNLLRCELIEKYLVEHKNSYLPLSFLKSNIKTCGTNKTKQLFDLLSDEIKESDEGKRLVKEIEKNEFNAIGKIIPDCTLFDTSEANIDLKSAVKGYTIINFWASWCGPCRLENKDLRNEQAYLSRKLVNLISISLDEDKNEWLKAIKKDGINWLQLSDLKGGFYGEVAKKFKITSIPYMILVDANGMIQAAGYRQIMKKVNEIK